MSLFPDTEETERDVRDYQAGERRCKWCIHFGTPDPRGSGFHECANIIHATGRGDPSFSKLAFVDDAEDYMASLWVHPDFGCVEWRSRQ